MPDNLSFEEAATLGVGVTTVGQGLYQSLELPLPGKPSSEKTSILIYGGSTATGSLAIQYAKLSGLQVIATCSPHNFEYVKSLGAGELNHSDPSYANCISQMPRSTTNLRPALKISKSIQMTLSCMHLYVTTFNIDQST